MNGKKVLITRKIPQSGLDVLAGCEVEVNPHDRELAHYELLAAAKGKDAVLTMLTDKIDAATMDALPTVRIYANYAVGYNNIDVGEAARRGITVTNTPGVLTDTTADLAWALLMAAARRLVPADRHTRWGRFTGWAPMLFLGMDVHHKTLGIIGMGRIGRAMARRAQGFGMKVLYAGGEPLPAETERELGISRVEMEALLSESDFISLHVPLTDATRGLIGDRELRRMKPTAVLVNTSRGPVVDEEALVSVLREGRIFAAGLDVYQNEPALARGLMDLDNVVLAPHIGSGSVETRERMAVMAAGSIAAFLRGETPENVVTPK